MTREEIEQSKDVLISFIRGECMTREEIEKSKEVLIPFIKWILTKWNRAGNGEADAEEFENDFNEIFDLALKSLEQKPKTGHWIFIENWYDLGRRLKCSECGQVFVLGDEVSRHYCANCGAKMEDEEVENGRNDD